jgi:FMN phosphatase YigB (HAD superfamily)
MKYSAVFFDWGDTLAPLDNNEVPRLTESRSGLLKKLYHASYRLAVISNTHRYQDSYWIRNELAKRGLLQCFEVVIASANYGIHKPDLRIFQKALDFLQIDPTKVLMVGDSSHADGASQFLGMGFLHVKAGEDWSDRLLQKLDDSMQARKLTNICEFCRRGNTLSLRLRHLSEGLEIGDRLMVDNQEMEITSLSRPVTKEDVLKHHDHSFVDIGVKEV